MSTTVGARLKVLSGMSNATVGAMLLAIGSGATVGAILVNYSGLATGTVAQHLLVDKATITADYGVGYRKRKDEDEEIFAIAAMLVPILGKLSKGRKKWTQ